MAYMALERKAELAVKAILDNVELDGVPIYIGGNSVDETEEGEQGMRPPYVMVVCDQGQPEMDGQLDGVMRMPIRVEVWTHKHDEPGDAHGDRVATVRDALMVDDIASQLSQATSDFCCFNVNGWSVTEDKSGIHFVSTVTLDAVCAAADFA